MGILSLKLTRPGPESGWTHNECPVDIMTRQQGGGTHVCVQHNRCTCLSEVSKLNWYPILYCRYAKCLKFECLWE